MDPIVWNANRLIAALWVIWIVVWTGAAFFVKRTQRREKLGPILLERTPVVVGFLMLLLPHWKSRGMPPALLERFMGEGPGLAAVALALVIGGLLVAYWARWHLGRNWSGEVMVKKGHSLITSGPYRWVRHPIYSGMTVALVGTALASGAPYGFIGLGLILFGFLVRVRQEEALMGETFPADYAVYSARTARLIPGLY
ncbi:MAG TPA: isoprenylcysteine carboxylmethyltransferase family protein [Stellaceae bacterium]|nr:isoprenylcysteine carboxylmethyltransferase family protein [Stellaceae bacterium]